MIDIGVNLTNKSFRSDLDAVLDRASDAGVAHLVITGTCIAASRDARELAKSRPGVLYSTAGVHPHDAKTCDSSTLDSLRELCADPRVVAVGECGLDYNRNFSPPDVQRTWFEKQVELAAELGMPLFLHEREAHDDLIAVLRRHRDRFRDAVVHCFTGSEQELRAYLDLDLHIGITGWICDERRGTHLRDIVSRIPAERLMIETDAPFLLPRSLRPKPKSRRNEPAYLAEVRDAVATCRGVSPDELAEQTTRTAERFFGLAPRP